MVRFQVPQFIETEPRLVGPFTLRQFLWVAMGGSIIFIAFALLNGIAFVAVAALAAFTSLAFAFLKIEDMPLINYVAYALSYGLNPKRYLYK